MRTRIATIVLLAALPRVVAAQSGATSTPRGWQLAGIPALNFNSDEGFGYGAIVQAFNYGNGDVRPYAYTIQPTLFLTTKGRRDASIFFDAPHLLPSGWRLGVYAAREQQLATPYYGIGNGTVHDTLKELPPNPYYYRFGRLGYRATGDLQHSVAGALRGLVGAGVRTSTIDQTPFDSGTTLLRAQTGGATISTGRVVYVRAGLVFDTRDRETGPTRGQWIEALIQHGDQAFGGTSSFTRLTTTVREYVPITDRTVFATRLIAQDLWGTAPFYDLSVIQGSFRDDEGLGGSSTLRGWPKNRFIGNGLALSNNELRWRAADFRFLGRESAIVMSAFVDVGRVFDSGIGPRSNDWHTGVGGGTRLRYGQDMVIALDVGHSKESTAPIYIGLGYLF